MTREVRFGSAVIDGEELARRHAKIRACMAAEKIDIFLIYSSPLRSMNVHYAANYDLIGEGALIVLPLDGEAVLYISEEWDLKRAAAVSPIKDIRCARDLARVCGQLLQQKGSAIAGLEWADSAFVAAVQASAGREAAGASALLERAACRKTDVELRLIREAAVLADHGFEHACKVVNTGMREFELQAELEYAMRRAGAVDNFGLFSSSKHNRVIGIPTDKSIETGDLLIFEITPARLNRNYSAQLCRTISMGEASKQAKERYQIIEEALEAALRLVKPGTLVSQVSEAQDEVISRYGFAEYCKPPYMRARGHGFGVGRVNLSSKNHQPLEAGMAMVLHPNQYFPDAGYLALGEMVIVIETGVERLSRLRPGIYERI